MAMRAAVHRTAFIYCAFRGYTVVMPTFHPSDLRDRVYERMTTEERMRGKYTQNSPDECWPWTGLIDVGGYGSFKDENRRNKKAHRAMYELVYGAIPENHVIDHTCHNGKGCSTGRPGCEHRRCVNPAHLEAVPNRVNLLRGLAAEGVSPEARVTHCKRGHQRTPENTYRYPSGRYACRICRIEQKRERRARGLRD